MNDYSELEEIDDLDRRILAILQEDAWITNQELARRVYASAPTCLRRVRRLRALGVIQRVAALLAPEKVGNPLTAIVEVTLDVQSVERLEAFEAHVGGEAAVTQCYRVSGGPDFVVIVLARDMPDYHDLVRRLFSASANVRNVRTFFSVHRSKFDVRAMTRTGAETRAHADGAMR